MKNVVKLNNYYFPEELNVEIKRFVEYYNNQRYHESLNNLAPADEHLGREREIELKRREIKRRILKQRKRYNLVEI
jgi:hypothetical protein